MTKADFLFKLEALKNELINSKPFDGRVKAIRAIQRLEKQFGK